jgi:multidrug resistance efflux pump
MESTTDKRRNGESSDDSRLKLPGIPDVENAGTNIVRRVVTLTFGVVALLFLVAALVGTLIEIDLTIDAQGTLEPVTVQPVRAQETAVVLDVPVTTGDTVATGDVLARLDSLDLTSQIARLRADRDGQWYALQRARALQPIEQDEQAFQTEQARAQLIAARAELREQLANYGYPTDINEVLKTYDTGDHIAIDRALSDVIRSQAALNASRKAVDRLGLARFDLRQQEAQIQKLDAQIATLEARLDRLVIRAPTDGVILTEQVERLPGRLVRQGDILFEVAEIDKWRVQLLVGQQDIHEIKLGDEAKVEIVAFKSEKKDLLYGTVESVASEPIGSASADPSGADRRMAAPGRGMYRVTVVLDESEVESIGRARLRDGYTVEGKIITRSGRIVTLVWRYLRGQAR